MQTFFFAAGLLAIAAGGVHSILGEVLIFSRMRDRTIVPTRGAPLLQERHVRILWATWHIVTVFGCAIGAILLKLAHSSSQLGFQGFVGDSIVVATLLSSLLVLIGTSARHPGWIGLLGVAVLTWIGQRGALI